MKNRIGFISLGCCKNLVDAERMITLLQSNGYSIASSTGDSDLIVVNTCGFINPSIVESTEAIKEALDTGKPVVVTGCLGARKEFLQQQFRRGNLVGITGPQDYDGVNRMICEALPLNNGRHNCFRDAPVPGTKLTPSHYAYLKISEGCSNHCSFCAIPGLRGKMISCPIDEIMYEADRLIERGTSELIVVAQDTMAYGRDLPALKRSYGGREYSSDIISLVDFLAEKDIWVRLHYLYPYNTIDSLIPYMQDGRIIPYLDIPFQHSSPRILKLMRRPGNIERLADRILEWKEKIPELCIRTSCIVGFPGETEDDFENLLDFIRKVRLDRVGCFIYSNVDGVKANELPDQISEEVKQERYDRFMEVQQKISLENMNRKIGSIQEAVVDDIDREEQVIITRSKFDSPEIDGQIYIPYDSNQTALLPQIGEHIRTRIYDANEYDLFGELPDAVQPSAEK